MHTIALFGGTFDPIHNGHIKTSEAVQAHFNFREYYFLPCKIPVLKSAASANTQQRMDMLQLALAPYSQFKIEYLEMERDSPSYMVDTLSSIRTERKDASITLILGFDSFLSFMSWHDWKKIIDLANLVIISREPYRNAPIDSALQAWLLKYKSDNSMDILRKKSGVIYEFDAGYYDISSTRIRQALRMNQSTESLLPQAVYQYIKQQGLYQ